jgi:cation transport regulator ChaB
VRGVSSGSGTRLAFPGAGRGSRRAGAGDFYKEAHGMPKDRKGATKPSRVDLPGTLERSPKKAQRTYRKTLASAHGTYAGDEERAHRAAYAAVKHSFEKVGDHWEPKQRKGPSDPQAKRGGERAHRRGGRTAGGVDAEGHTKKELMARARKLGVHGRSRMDKLQLARAIAKKQG